MSEEKNFATYEYKTKTVKAYEQTRTIDLYEAFGWEVTATTPTAIEGVTLTLKRERKQRHKSELNRLERQAENVYQTIAKLERARTKGAKWTAMVTGICATLLFGGGLSWIMTTGGSVSGLIGGIILGIIGGAVAVANYPLYKKLVEKKTERILPAIDDNEDKLANLLEQGDTLLRSELI